jgi:hypothetical protein
MEVRRPKSHHPSLLAMASFAVKSKALQAKRTLLDTLSRLPRLDEGEVTDFPFVMAESSTPLCTGYAPRERPLLSGKIENLRLACRQIHCRILAPGETFSFWRQVGPPWRLRGFALGREVREGCVIPTTGGGLCQLSGSLLDLALALDFELIERHRHTSLPVDVPHDPRRDATLFWNYVDLRFRSTIPALFECYLTEDSLIVRLRGKKPRLLDSRLAVTNASQVQPPAPALIEGCFTCGETACVRHRVSDVATIPERPRRFWKLF